MNINFKNRFSIGVMVFLMLFSIIGIQPIYAAPDNIYTGTSDATALLKNIQFRDVESQGGNYWARDAIYEMASLSVIKGYGEKTFGRTAPITKVQALALIYRSIGKEEEAIQAAEIIENQRNSEERRINAVEVWADGYLQLAANDGLISAQQLNDALEYEQGELDPQYQFIKTAPAQRQEVAEWMAKALGLAPVYDQQQIFNSFQDWRTTDPLKIPYIEVVLQAKIMNGTPEGYLYPRNSIPREQMAQVLKNAEEYIIQKQGWIKKSGYIQEITEDIQQNIDKTIKTITFKIRNDEGKIDHILVNNIYAPGNKIETNHMNDSIQQNEVIVLGKGVPGDSALLGKDNKITYIADTQKKIKNIKITGTEAQADSLEGIIAELDTDAMRITILDKQGRNFTYQISNQLKILIKGHQGTMDNLIIGSPVELLVKNNIVIELEQKEKKPEIDASEVTGIIEDINPMLGYITLYDISGKKSFNLLRVYNFSNPSLVEIMRNGRKDSIENIQPGDSAFLKLDEQGYVTHIASSQNYEVKYAKVLNKTPSSILVKFDDGMQEILDIEKDTIITKDKQITSYQSVEPGNNIKVVLHRADNFTKLKEIAIGGNQYAINNIYKASIYYYDEYNGNLIVRDLKRFELGKWTLTEGKGFAEIPVDEKASVYAGEQSFNLEDVNKYHVDGETYIAVEKGLGGIERAVLISLRNSSDTERLYNDEVRAVTTGTGEFKVNRESETFRYTKGSIIIKNGKLIAGNNLISSDNAYIVANRNYSTGEFNADIIQVQDGKPKQPLIVYRGRIKEINENKDFTVESFSALNGLRWDYANTPKTFTLTRDTRILNIDGVVNNREFNEYSPKAYLDKVVTIVCDGVEALLISEAPYGVHNFKGEVYLQYGKKVSDSLSLKKVSLYNRDTGNWDKVGDAEITLRKDTVILKNGKPVSASQILRSSNVRVIKSNNDITGEGLIIIIED